MKNSATTLGSQTGSNTGGIWNKISGFGKANALEAVNRGLGRAATPVFSVSSGTYYTASLSFTISCATPGATIRYTNNGTQPTSSSPIYTPGQTITISQTTTFQAKAFHSGMLDSYPETAYYELKSGQAPPDGQTSTGDINASVYKGVIQYDGSGYAWDSDANKHVGSGNIMVNSSNNKARVFYQWNLGDNLIPNDATITSIQLQIPFNSYSSSQQIKLISINSDLNGLNSTLWNSASSGSTLASGISVSNFWLTLTYTPASNASFINAVKNSLSGNVFQLAIVAENESSGNFQLLEGGSYRPILNIIFTAPARSVTVRNQLDTDFNKGQISVDGHWYDSPYPLHTYWGKTHIFEATSGNILSSSENWKFKNWSNSTPTSLIQTYNVSNNNVTISAVFNKICSVTVKNNLEGTEGGQLTYQGSTVNSGYTEPDILQNTTRNNITANITQIGPNQRTYYFVNWNDGTMSAVHPPITVTQSMTLIANYKSIQISSDANAFVHNNQRKMVRVDNSPNYVNLMHTYESMGKVWLEMSTDGGTTWALCNNGQPLSGNNDSKSPSLTNYNYNGFNYYAVVFQENHQGTSRISCYTGGPNSFVVANFPNEPYTSVDMSPVIAYGKTALMEAMVVVRLEHNEPAVLPVRKPGIYYMFGRLTGTGYMPSDSGNISNINSSESDINSKNPTLSGYGGASNSVFSIAWEQQFYGGSSSKINYCRISEEMTWNSGFNNYIGTPSFNLISNISNGDGFSLNSSPSITLRGFVNNSANALICWSGAYYNGGSKTVVLKDPENGTSFRQYGNTVESPTIVSLDNYSGYMLAWSQYGGSFSWMADAYQVYTNNSLNVPGSYIQLSNGSGLSTMYAKIFQHAAAPKTFATCNLQSGRMNKVSKTLIVKSIQGSVIKDSAQFCFLLGSIKKNEENICFVNKPDSSRINSIQSLNNFLITEPFSVDKNSNISFNISYGTIDSLAAQAVLKNNQYVSYRVNLIDDSNGKTLGTFCDVRFDKNNLTRHKEINCKVNNETIGEKTVRLKLEVKDNLAGDYIYTDRSAGDDLTFNKKQEKEINLDESNIIKNYALQQNYPNPFNPSTMINYQLPKTCKVALRIYDILGKEVALLVDKYQTDGKYSVEFNAGNLPSGIYIYRLTANDFIESKKMMLIK